jgi:pimeloyl-ACP methyl ester carboxylesterase
VSVDEHTIYFDESPVYYRSADPTDVPPVYVHGIPTSSDDWIPFLERSGGYAPDLFGFGRSGKGGHLDYSLRGLSEFLERWLTELQIDRLKLVGHDWGAAVALTFAQRHPDRVARLVVCNAPTLPGGLPAPRLIRLLRLPGVGEMVMGATTRGMLARTLRHGCINPQAWPDSRVAAVWDQFDQGTQRAILRLVRSAGDNAVGVVGGPGDGRRAGAATPGGPGQRRTRGTDEPGGPGQRRTRGTDEPGGPGQRRTRGTDEPGGPGQRRTRGTDEPGGPGEGQADAPGSGNGAPPAPPALIVWGERDPWYPPALAGAYAERLPHAAVERIPDAGHWPWLDRPDVVEIVVRFLEA